jgi:hypothetical protein
VRGARFVGVVTGGAGHGRARPDPDVSCEGGAEAPAAAGGQRIRSVSTPRR